MKLDNIKSSELLPRFAKNIAWLMNALDDLVKDIAQRSKSIDAPLTMDAIQACTDEELEALYNQYGVAIYYPDLSRETRELMLYNMCKIYRYLGTPKAIEILCNYIFDNLPLNVNVLDNLAFDDNGNLIDSSLLDIFDIELDPDLPVLDEDANARILANIIRFSRNSQSLRNIYYDFIENFDLQIEPIEAGIPAQYWNNDAICEPAIVTYTLSFVNTQLPDITITMPPSETGPSGTVVTLPTMSGEYESGGKTWTPSTWDIGAFGSSYTISDNTVAHLVFVEVPAVTFIIADAVTGEIIATFSDELIVEPLGNLVMQDSNIIIGIPHTVPIQNFWFTANGQNEQDDSLLPTFGYDIDLYNADGTRASGAQYDGAYPLTYMKADGNMFVYGDDRIIINGGVDLLGLESDEENNRSAWSVQVEKIS